jgi:hypothetical protein
MEGMNRDDCVLVPPLGPLALHGVEHIRPLCAQRFDDRGNNQPLHIGTGRVVRAEPAALLGIERLFEERAEDRWIDVAPIALGGRAQFADFFAADIQGRMRLEELAVEAFHLRFDRVGKRAGVHCVPELAHHRLEFGRVGFAPLQQLHERVFRQQLDRLREHREQAALASEGSSDFGSVQILISRSRMAGMRNSSRRMRNASRSGNWL